MEVDICLFTLDQALEGRDWLVGESCAVANFSVYGQLWDLRPLATYSIPQKYRNFLSWKERMEKITGAA